MYLRFRFLNHRIVFYNRRIYETGGINSNLKNGLHVPMFDFDYINIRELETEMMRLRDEFNLGQILIMNTGKYDSYHGIVLNAMSWRDAVALVASCKYTDLKHLQFSLRRGHFTLRVLPKAGRKLYLTSIIRSENPSDVRIKDIDSYVLYETANK